MTTTDYLAHISPTRSRRVVIGTTWTPRTKKRSATRREQKEGKHAYQNKSSQGNHGGQQSSRDSVADDAVDDRVGAAIN
jgi:hypothetical protein